MTEAKNRKIRVMFVANSLSGGGTERVVTRILCHLDRNRFEPALVLLIREGIFLGDIPEDVPVIDLGRYRQGGRIRWLWKFAREIRERRPDVIFGFLWFVNLSALLARFLSGTKCKVVISERTSLEQARESWSDDILRRIGIRWFYRYADRVVPNSAEMGRQFLSHVRGLQAEKVVPIQNPLDLNGILQKSSKTDNRIPGPGGLPVVAGMGRMVRAKGFDLLIGSMKCSRNPFRLALLGEGEEKENLERLASAFRFPDRVEFLGFMDNPYPFLRKAAVFVLPSRFEGFPNALLEAMALGLPCVATKCPTGPGEIITDGLDGLLVPQGDPTALAGAIDRLLSDPELRERIGRAGSERARAFDVSRIVPKFEQLIEEVAS